MRVSIVAGEIRVGRWAGYHSRGSGRIQSALWILQVAYLRAQARGYRLPDVELVMHSSDGAQSTVDPGSLWANPAPMLGSTKCGTDASVSFPMSLNDDFGAYNGRMTLRLYKNSETRRSTWDRPAWEVRALYGGPRGG